MPIVCFKTVPFTKRNVHDTPGSAAGDAGELGFFKILILFKFPFSLYMFHNIHVDQYNSIYITYK